MFTGSMLVLFRYPFAHEVKGAGPFIIGGITTALILTEALFAAPIGRLADRIGRKKLYYMLTPVYCLSYLLFAFAPSPEWLLPAGFLMGFRMLTNVSGSAMTPELVPMDCIGRWRGIIGLCTGLITIPAPIIGGFVWEHLGPRWVFIIPVVIDMLVRLPILPTVPETLNRNQSSHQ
jgi:DHA1 family bicyclomycin/chloramphenicol resistance-like MFS transporter